MKTLVGENVTASWSSLAFRGAASILFGVVAIAWPGITLKALTLLFGAYAFADGVITLVYAAQRGARPHRWLLVLDGLLGVGVGVATIFWPTITLLGLVLLVGARFTAMGVLEITAAVKLRHDLRNPVLYGLAGFVSIALGIITFVMPGLSALVLLMMLAAYAFAFGALLLALAFRLRRAHHVVPVPA
jgi:uncharacterized membrane protein HdeD (DUF308 family)